jgi:hypothetical protein
LAFQLQVPLVADAPASRKPPEQQCAPESPEDGYKRIGNHRRDSRRAGEVGRNDYQAYRGVAKASGHGEGRSRSTLCRHPRSAVFLLIFGLQIGPARFLPANALGRDLKGYSVGKIVRYWQK